MFAYTPGRQGDLYLYFSMRCWWSGGGVGATVVTHLGGTYQGETGPNAAGQPARINVIPRSRSDRKQHCSDRAVGQAGAGASGPAGHRRSGTCWGGVRTTFWVSRGADRLAVVPALLRRGRAGG